MFCPTCGRDNPSERKFCSSCGTNLEAVSQVLSGGTTDFFTKMDSSFDQFIARYAEHVFKDAQSNAADRKVSNSWKLLGKGILTSFVDVFVALILLNFFSLRFNILWISTPFRLLSERSRRQKTVAEGGREDAPANERLEQPEQEWLPGSVASISEHTTERLQEYRVSGEPRSQHRE
jgi:Double zinc ribbon